MRTRFSNREPAAEAKRYTSVMKPTEPPFRILSLSPLRSGRRRHLWEWAWLKPDAEVAVGLNVSFIPSENPSEVTLRLKTTYTAMRDGILRPLLEYEMEARFAVEGTPTPALLTETAVYLPSNLLALMLQVAVGALRGMLAVELQGTPLAQHPLPIYDISSLVGSLRA